MAHTHSLCVSTLCLLNVLLLLTACLGIGIPIDLLPITPTGIVKTTYLKQWIKLRVQIEQNIDDVTRTGEDIGLVECPGSSDVLFRPGKPVMNHIGNVSFRSLIEPLLDVHEQCTQTQKFALVQHVVEELITKRHGRFLTWDNAFGCWRPLADPKKTRTEGRDCVPELENPPKGTTESANYGRNQDDTSLPTFGS